MPPPGGAPLFLETFGDQRLFAYQCQNTDMQPVAGLAARVIQIRTGLCLELFG